MSAARVREPTDGLETPEQWVALGERIHGGFGSLIALGIRIGLDATQRLGSQGRALDVVYRNGPVAPCSCTVDGIMLATRTSPGQGSLHVGAPISNAALFGSVAITDTVRHKTLRYAIPASVGQLMERINGLGKARQRYDAVMALPERRLFSVSTAGG
jgi:formylmethanofuran dehydrogenase subunit E